MIDTSKKPKNYSVCQTLPGECPLAETCLRSIAFQLMMEGKKQDAHINVVNPYNPENHYRTEQCIAHRPTQKVRFARGMRHIFDNVKTCDFQSARWRVCACFSCESYFYRSQNGFRLITPEEQAKIMQIIMRYTNAAPQFDSYVEEIDW